MNIICKHISFDGDIGTPNQTLALPMGYILKKTKNNYSFNIERFVQYSEDEHIIVNYLPSNTEISPY